MKLRCGIWRWSGVFWPRARQFPKMVQRHIEALQNYWGEGELV